MSEKYDISVFLARCCKIQETTMTNKEKSGAYGRVVLDEKRKLAIKHMPLEQHREYSYFMIREMSILRKCQRLRIPNVVQLQKVTLDNNESTLTLQFPLYASCLYDFLIHERCAEERIRIAKLCLKSMLLTLAHLHRYNIIYRDLKPSNMLLDYNRTHVVLADFGGSREVPMAAAKTDKTCVGLSNNTCTLLYSSPEALGRHYSFPSDIYSLGVSIFQIMTGAIMENEPLQLSSALRVWNLFVKQYVVDATLAQLIRDMLAFQISDRPTAEQALQRLHVDVVYTAPNTPNPLGKYWRKMGDECHFSSSIRQDITKWICDAVVFFDVDVGGCIYAVHLLDDFVAASGCMTSLQLSCIATACVLIILKFITVEETFWSSHVVTELGLSQKFTPDDVVSWEKCIIATLDGNILGRPVPKLLRTLPFQQVRRILSDPDYVLGNLADLILRTTAKTT